MCTCTCSTVLFGKDVFCRLVNIFGLLFTLCIIFGLLSSCFHQCTGSHSTMLMLTCSLMESFVPFGGFFSMPSDLKSPLGVSYQCPSRCHLCNEKCEQDMSAITKGGLASSVAEQYQSGLPSWLQMTEVRTNRAFDIGGLFFYTRILVIV